MTDPPLATPAAPQLTDFAGASRPSIPMCSLFDMIFNPADIITKLKLLFIVVITLFSIMCLGAAVGFVMDMRERRGIVLRMQDPKVGFCVSANGTWLWRFTLSPLRSEIDAPQGSAVALADLLGIPTARLRAALPDELLSWDMAAALGRRRALSRAAMNDTLKLHRELLPRLVSVPLPLQRFTKHIDVTANDDDEHELVLTSDVDVLMEEFVGTALVLGFLQAASLLPVAELAQRISDAKAYFGQFVTPAGWDFAKTQTDFVTLLSPGVLNGTHKWLIRCRLWRLILSQNAQGYWDASTTTAFALEARDAKETQGLPPTPLQQLLSLLGGVGAAIVQAEEDDGDGARHENDETAMDDIMTSINDARDARRTKKGIDIFDSGGGEDAGGDPSALRMPSLLRRSVDKARAAALMDCPLSCSVSAIPRSMPRALAQLRLEDPSINVERVWTTLLCICVLERITVSWIWGDGDLYPEEERTIVDGAREWIESHALEHPGLAAVLEDGSVKRRAEKVTILWHRAAELRVLELRRAPAIRTQMHRSHVHRTLTNIVRAVVNQHGASSCARGTISVARFACFDPSAIGAPQRRSRRSFQSRCRACSVGRVRTSPAKSCTCREVVHCVPADLR